MKILVCGMPRSMTTWAFNVLRELIKDGQIETIWIDSNEPKIQDEFAVAESSMLGKCHHYSKILADNSNLIIYSYRDIRTAAVSASRKFGSPCLKEQLESWVEHGNAWLPLAHIVLRYEYVERQPLETIRRLRKLMIDKFGAVVCTQMTEEEIMHRVDDAFARQSPNNTIDYDRATLIIPAHRTFQPAPEKLSGSELQIYQRVEKEFGLWLTEHGYINSDAHGQELEYRISKRLLSRILAPVVVDVGVEKGSFAQLAIEAGAAKLIGYEPLPRHIEYLLRKYAGQYQVEIHPCAVSACSGESQLHIATDLDGNELDFHHTLSDLGDSSTVVRSERSLQVTVVSLGDQYKLGRFPHGIDFLKIDTDGHDLSVIQGLGELRPKIIMAEFWDSLPDSSGQNIYSLEELAALARVLGYSRTMLIRRHGRIELVEFETYITNPGDWGNIFFFHDDFNYEEIRDDLQQFASEAFDCTCKYVASLLSDLDAKETVIQNLMVRDEQNTAGQIGREFSEPTEIQSDVPGVMRQSIAVSSKIENLTAELAASMQAQVEKEEVIRALSRSLLAYRLAYKAVRPLAPLIGAYSFIHRHVRAMLRPRLGELNQYAPRELSNTSSRQHPVSLTATPKISIVTPSFKQGPFIERTLLSVLNQQYPNLEYFVQDGGSTDGTVDILQTYNSRLAGWVTQRDGGQSQAINLGFAKTSGDIMAWLNSDDMLMPGALATVADYFNRHPDVDVVYGNRLLVDVNDMEIGRWIMPGHDSAVLSWVDYVPQETLFWRRRIWDKVGGQVDESFRFAMDWDLLVRFRDAGAKFAHIPRFLGAFRIHEQQKTSANINDIGHQEMDRIRMRLLGSVPTQNEIRKKALPFILRHVVSDLSYRVYDRCRR